MTWMISKVIHPQAFSNVVFRTAVQQLRKFKLTWGVARSLCDSCICCRVAACVVYNSLFDVFLRAAVCAGWPLSIRFVSFIRLCFLWSNNVSP